MTCDSGSGQVKLCLYGSPLLSFMSVGDEGVGGATVQDCARFKCSQQFQIKLPKSEKKLKFLGHYLGHLNSPPPSVKILWRRPFFAYLHVAL